MTVYLAKLSIQRQMEYPVFLISWCLLIPLQYLGGLWMLKILANRFQNIGGWEFPELAFLYGLGLLSHAFIVIIFMQVWRIEDFVLTGGFDRLLLRPVGVLYLLISSNINLIGFIDLIPAVITFGYACSLLHVEWTTSRFFELSFILAGAVLIRAGIYLALGSLAFWTGKSRPFLMGGMSLMDRATNYPQSIYPYFIQVVLSFIVPIGFISFFPTCQILGKPHEFSLGEHTWLWTLTAGFLFFSLSVFIYHMGLRRYESAGS